jgi:hypothetical protein
MQVPVHERSCKGQVQVSAHESSANRPVSSVEQTLDTYMAPYVCEKRSTPSNRLGLPLRVYTPIKTFMSQVSGR